MQAILSELARNRDGDVDDIVLGNGMGAKAEALTDPRAIAKSIAVRAWRLTTADGQTLYVTKVDARPGRSGAERPRGKKNSVQSPSTAAGTPAAATTAGAVDTDAGTDVQPAEALYVVFCRQLNHLLRMREMTPKEIATALDLVSGQVGAWLERAEREREVSRVSRRPVRFALPRKSLL